PDAGTIGLTGSFEADGDIVFTFDILNIASTELFDLTATGGAIAVGPGTTAIPLLSVETAVLTLPFLGEDVELEADNIEIARSGALSATTIALRPGTLAETLGIANL